MSSKIKDIKLFSCGSCVNNLGIVFKGHPKEERHFPAMVGLIIHEDLGPVLYDTGYSEAIFKNGIISKLYNLLNEATIDPSDVITEQLKGIGINPSDVKNIILSHAHPDHIGAFPLFSDFNLITTQEVLDTMASPRLFDLVFKNMQPGDYVKKIAVKPMCDKVPEFLTGFKTYDVLGDGSIIGVSLDGHAKGQLGLFFPERNLLLASDSCWGTDLMDFVPNMRFIPRLIQNNFDEYKDTVSKLSELKKSHPEINIVFSHQIGGFGV